MVESSKPPSTTQIPNVKFIEWPDSAQSIPNRDQLKDWDKKQLYAFNITTLGFVPINTVNTHLDGQHVFDKTNTYFDHLVHNSETKKIRTTLVSGPYSKFSIKWTAPDDVLHSIEKDDSEIPGQQRILDIMDYLQDVLNKTYKTQFNITIIKADQFISQSRFLTLNFLIATTPTQSCILPGVIRVNGIADIKTGRFKFEFTEVAYCLYEQTSETSEGVKQEIDDLKHSFVDHIIHFPGIDIETNDMTFENKRASLLEEFRDIPHREYVIPSPIGFVHYVETEKNNDPLDFFALHATPKFTTHVFNLKDLKQFEIETYHYDPFRPTPEWFEGRLILHHNPALSDLGISQLRDVFAVEPLGDDMFLVHCENLKIYPVATIQKALMAAAINRKKALPFMIKKNGSFDFSPLLRK